MMKKVSRISTNKTTQTFLLLVMIWAVVILGCAWWAPLIKSKPYWTNGCVSSDGSVMGVSGGYDAALIDLKTGEVTKQMSGIFVDVACLPSKDVVALESSTARWLTTEKEIKREAAWDVIGTFGDEQILISDRDSRTNGSSYSFDGPLQIAVEDLSDGKRKKTIDLLPELFADVGKGNVNYFQTFPVRVLSDGRLLLAAGFQPDFDGKTVESRPWGYFLLDVENGEVKPFGKIKTGDDDVHLYSGISRFAATEDGKIIVGAFGDEKELTVVVLKDDEELFRAKIRNAREVFRLRLNQEGNLLAVSVVEPKDPKGRVDVFDIDSGEMLWQMKTERWYYFVEFLEDDSLILMTDKREVFRKDGRSGEVKWRTKQPE